MSRHGRGPSRPPIACAQAAPLAAWPRRHEMSRARATVLASALALATVTAQESCLRPAADAGITCQLDLQPLAGPAANVGLSALLAVPEFHAVLLALRDRAGAALAEMSDLQHVRRPGVPRLQTSPIDCSKLQRLTFVGQPEGRGPLAVLLDFLPAHTAAAAAAFDAAVAELQHDGAAFRLDTPWPDSRRAVVGDPAVSPWVAVRGRQLLYGIGDVGLQVQPTVATTGGMGIDYESGLTGRPRRDALDRAVAQLLGFAGEVRVACRLRLDGCGFDEMLGYRGRLARLPTSRALAAAPALPRLAQQLLMVRANVDPAWLTGLLDAYAADFLAGVDLQPYRELLTAATGAFSLGFAAPARGGLYPRLALALRVQQGEAVFAGLRRRAESGDWPGLKILDVDGLPTAMLSLPGVPPALRPSLCCRDGVLLLAESPATLRAVRRALGEASDDVFADAGARTCPAPDGATVIGEVWFDAEAIYRTAASIWGTGALAMALMPDQDNPLWQVPEILGPHQLPDPRELAATLGRGRGVLYVGDGEAGLRVAAPALGPLLAAGLGTGMVLVPKFVPMAMQSLLRPMQVEAAVARATRLGAALQSYRAAHVGQLPAKLTDLVELLPPNDPEPLWAPHDPAPLPDGVTAGGRCSFQLAPTGMTAAPALPAAPGTRPAPGQPLPERRAKPVFAFCGAGYLGHHLVILADGGVIWIRSSTLLEAVTGKAR